MPFLSNMILQDCTQKPPTKSCNFIPNMPNKFVERSFLVGGFVGSKSQAWSSPSRAQISLNDVIFEQLVHLGLNICSGIISKANSNTTNKMMSENVSVTNLNSWRSNMSCHNNWRSPNMGSNNWRSKMSNKCHSNTSRYFDQIPGSKHCGTVPTQTNAQIPITKHSQEELVYEDKDEGGNSIYVYQEVQKSTCEVTKTSMFHVRSRTISNTSVESDDSFIIFESNDEDDDVICNDEEEEPNILGNYEEDEDDDSSSDESSECDEVDHLAILECQTIGDTSSHLLEANEKWNSPNNSVILKKSPKKVSFPTGKQLAQVKVMVTWDYAHRAARKGPWETLALDSSRFKTKIHQLSHIISPILENGHRKTIFEQRFQSSSP